MDKASASGAGDSRFESWAGQNSIKLFWANTFTSKCRVRVVCQGLASVPTGALEATAIARRSEDVALRHKMSVSDILQHCEAHGPMSWLFGLVA